MEVLDRKAATTTESDPGTIMNDTRKKMALSAAYNKERSMHKTGWSSKVKKGHYRNAQRKLQANYVG